MSDHSVHLSSRSASTPASRPVRRGRLASLSAIFALLIVLVLAVAWIDGGERALRPISEPVALPAAAGDEVQN